VESAWHQFLHCLKEERNKVAVCYLGISKVVLQWETVLQQNYTWCFKDLSCMWTLLAAGTIFLLSECVLNREILGVWENTWAFIGLTKLITQPDVRLCGTKPGCNESPKIGLQISRGRTDLRLLHSFLTKFWFDPEVRVLLKNDVDNKHGVAQLLQHADMLVWSWIKQNIILSSIDALQNLLLRNNLMLFDNIF